MLFFLASTTTNLSDQQLQEIFSELDQSGTWACCTIRTFWRRHFESTTTTTCGGGGGSSRLVVDESLVADAFDHLDVDNNGVIVKDNFGSCFNFCPKILTVAWMRRNYY